MSAAEHRGRPARRRQSCKFPPQRWTATRESRRL